MKSFLIREWFKLLVSLSLLFFSIAFLIIIKNSNNSASVSFPPPPVSGIIRKNIYYDEEEEIPVGFIMQNGTAFTVWSSGTISKTKLVEK